MKETIHNEAKSLASGHTNTGDFHFFTDMLTATECASRKSPETWRSDGGWCVSSLTHLPSFFFYPSPLTHALV